MRGFGEIAERLRRSTVQVFVEPRRGRRRAESGSSVPGGGDSNELHRGGANIPRDGGENERRAGGANEPRGGGSHERRGGGSGVIWRADGAILTNAHVARDDSPDTSPEVELWDGRRFPARVTSRDGRRDLALLRIEGSDLEAAAIGDSSSLRPGELVLAVGSPLGFAGALSRGVVHSTGPISGMGKYPWVRASAQLAPGNSGGPLANARGEVIGINTAIFNGLGLAIPANAAADFVARGPRPALGVTLQPEEHGLRILHIEPNGPAARASLLAGDLLLGTFDSLADALDSGRDVLAVQFLRTNRVRETHVQLGVRAEAA